MRGLTELKAPVPGWLKGSASTYSDHIVGVVLHWPVVSASVTWPRLCFHLMECVLMLPGEAKAQLGLTGLTTPSGLFLIASSRKRNEGAAPVAPESDQRSEGGASDDVGLPQCPDCLWQFATGRGLS